MESRLRKFAKIVETQNYTKAALALHTSQPALSVAMQKLERELGGSLFVRRGGALTLTPLGRAAYAYSQQLAASQRAFRQQLAELAGRKPPLAIGMIDSLANTVLANGDVLATLERDAQLTVTVNNSRVLVDAIEHGELDIACIVNSGQTHAKNLRLTQLGNEPLIGVAHTALPKAAATSNFIAYDKQSFTGKLIQTHLQRRNVAAHPVFHSTSPEVMLHMVLLKRGWAVLPYSLVADHLHKGRLHTTTEVILRPIAALASLQSALNQVKQLLAAITHALQSQQNAARLAANTQAR